MIITGDRARRERRHSATVDDQRGPFQRDRDRVLYCSAFRRLAGVTQIARAGEADFFHTRLTHTMKVAQVGRRLAEHILHDQPTEADALGLDAEVVETACLAHDLGHAPFGHLGETVLNRLVLDKGDQDGFEGNAQSFRIITKLAVRFECDGLDLTRATLAACIKYPWYRDQRSENKSKKWGVYSTERDDFEFARQKSTDTTKTAEAELMDWADDIAYSVHDLEDFHRGRLLPWRIIFGDQGRDRLVKSALEGDKSISSNRLRKAHGRLARLVDGLVGDLFDQPYEGTREQRRAIRLVTSTLIGRYIKSIKLRIPDREDVPCVEFNPDARAEVQILKRIAKEYIIETPSLQGQQHGQTRVLEDLFEDLFSQGSERFVPRRFEHMLSGGSRARCVTDCLASLTETETVALHARLRGYASGSVLDPIVY